MLSVGCQSPITGLEAFEPVTRLVAPIDEMNDIKSETLLYSSYQLNLAKPSIALCT